MNEARRFLRGGPLSEALDSQEDSIQQHTHYVNDPGHSHDYIDTYKDDYNGLSGPADIDWEVESFVVSHRRNSYASKSGVSVESIQGARYDTETRPKNMKVTFIMKVCNVPTQSNG